MKLSGRDYADMWRCAYLILELECCAKALPIGETFCGSEQKGGDRSFLEWAFQMDGVATDLGLKKRLDEHYSGAEKKDTSAARQYWRHVRAKGSLLKDGLRIVEKVFR